MRRPQIIGLAVAFSAGLVAFVLVRGMVNQPPVEKRVEIQAKSSGRYITQPKLVLVRS